ncbi:hypothetical protein BJX96DRAFT_174951 [Aspergillus floccosus]
MSRNRPNIKAKVSNNLPGCSVSTKMMTSGEPGCSVLTKIMDSGEFSDLTFTCIGRRFKVHKAIVCAQSEPLKAADMQESQTGTITMDNFHVQTVKNFVQFMYTGDYDSNDPPDDNRGPGSDGIFYREGIPISMNAPYASLPDYGPQWTANEVSRTETPAMPTLLPTAAAALLNHIRANSIGNYYRVDKLVTLANSRLKRLIQWYGGSKDLLSVLPTAAEEAVGSTGDKELLEILASSVGSHIRDLETLGLLDQPRLKGLGFESDFSIKVLQKCSRAVPASGRVRSVEYGDTSRLCRNCACRHKQNVSIDMDSIFRDGL